MDKMVTVENVSKHFGNVTALQDVSFEVTKGELFGIIGPDGSGKSTLFRLLTTLLIPDEGTLTVDGKDTVKDYKEVRNIVGYMPGRFSLYQDMTIEENLNFFASVFGTSIEENYDLIKDIYYQIEPFKNRRAGKLSGGMKQKLALCCALIHRPMVLFLDEPTTGVDPVSRYEFWQMLYGLRQEKITIIVSTPYMDEAKLCDRMALTRNGKILQISTPDEIANSYGKPIWQVTGKNLYRLMKEIRKNINVDSCNSFGDSLHISFADKNYSQKQLLDELIGKGYEGISISEIKAGIEDCYMKLSEE